MLGQTGNERFFFASDYVDMAMEICRLSISPNAAEVNLYEKDCTSLVVTLIELEDTTRLLNGRKSKDRRNHRIISKPKSRPNANVNSSDDTRLFGSSIYPVERVPDSIPWLCSLRTRGFRGRHRCGVTLLSGGVILKYMQAIV